MHIKKNLFDLRPLEIAKWYRLGVILLAVSFLLFQHSGSEISLTKADSVVYSQTQTIEGVVSDVTYTTSGTLFVNDENYSFEFSPSDGTFDLEITLQDSISDIYAKISTDDSELTSDTLRLTLGYQLRPEIKIIPEVNGRQVIFKADILENPRESSIQFVWDEDPDNKHFAGLDGKSGSQVQFIMPEDAPSGEYYYNVTGITENGKKSSARTFLTVDSTKVLPFDINQDQASWINSAIIYGITPYIFTENARFHHITQKIPDIAELGVNTLWLQPIYETYEKGQGYGITNYFKVRSDLGTEEDLRELIETAHQNDLKVLFDFVPNHSSIQHPYARETVDLGESSHYYDFYQRDFDTSDYSQHYHHHPEGFVRYFWEHLPNLNYHNPEVKRWITEAGKYWIEKFDIDGYRIDAVWGVNARNPEFMQEWRSSLKRIKPEIMLLGEDKATRDETFDQRFDAAYDWTESESWVSQWVWQTSFSEEEHLTIFNDSEPGNRANLLRNSLTNNGNGYHPDARILRFLENNDTYRFIDTHSLDQTKMAAALTFTLHGNPLLFNGQEIGAALHPYQTTSIYNVNLPIKSQSRQGLYKYYKRLIEIRSNFSALDTQNFEEIEVNPSESLYAFRRWNKEDNNIFVVANMGDHSLNGTLKVPVNSLNLTKGETYYLSDLITGDYYEVIPEDLYEFRLPLYAHTTTILVLDDHIVELEEDDSEPEESNERFELHQNYPNPFRSTTTIRYHISEANHVDLSIYNLLGKKIKILVDGDREAGAHEEVLDFGELASGIYFYELSSGNDTSRRKMTFIK